VRRIASTDFLRWNVEYSVKQRPFAASRLPFVMSGLPFAASRFPFVVSGLPFVVSLSNHPQRDRFLRPVGSFGKLGTNGFIMGHALPATLVARLGI
jgi:hypothetical protein